MTRSQPHSVIIILKDARIKNEQYTIINIELRQYIKNHDKKLGDYSLITLYVETDRGNIELKYDEGFRGKDALHYAVELLQFTGISSMINRAIIEMESKGDRNFNKETKDKEIDDN